MKLLLGQYGPKDLTSIEDLFSAFEGGIFSRFHVKITTEWFDFTIDRTSLLTRGSSENGFDRRINTLAI